MRRRKARNHGDIVIEWLVSPSLPSLSRKRLTQKSSLKGWHLADISSRFLEARWIKRTSIPFWINHWWMNCLYPVLESRCLFISLFLSHARLLTCEIIVCNVHMNHCHMIVSCPCCLAVAHHYTSIRSPQSERVGPPRSRFSDHECVYDDSFSLISYYIFFMKESMRNA